MNLPGIGDPEDWESRWHDSKLTLMLTPPSNGWIHLVLVGTPRGNVTEVGLSYCFDYFYELLKWVQQVLAGPLPAEFDVNEEGPWVEFRALAVPQRPEWIELRLTRFSYDEDDNELPGKLLFRCRLERRQLAHEFYRRWEQWIREDYIADAWSNRSPSDPAESGKPFGDVRTLEVLNELRKYLESTTPVKHLGI